MKTKYFFPSRISSLAKLNRMLDSDEYQNARFFIIVDENTYQNCLPVLISKVSALEKAEFFEVPVSEEAKSLEVAAQLWGALLDSGADRNSVILNLGGGCVSDIGGFVAAGYKRGIRYINIPTTLIGMIDASVGGKTAVNVDNAKNQVGFFHQPEAVCLYPDFLDTLAVADLQSGLFEMLKTFLLSDSKAFDTLVYAACNCPELPLATIKQYVQQCVDFKKSVVEADPQEKSIRKILNLGHTFGHAIESFSIENDAPLSHGAAVGIGLKCELYLSVNKLGLSESVYGGLCKVLQRFVAVPQITLRDTERILEFMRMDKKNADGLILCVLLQEIGVPVIDVSIDENEVRDALLKAGKF